MHSLKKILFYLIISGWSYKALSLTFSIMPHSDIIGAIQTAIVQPEESLADIGRRFDVGIYEMIEANPDLDPWVPAVGSTVVIPTQFILPPGLRKGMVINLAEMRIYYYHSDKYKTQHKNKIVTTHPIGIGKKGWQTPLGNCVIIQKQENPYWLPPQSIRLEHAKRGDDLPKVVPPGPDNPLGKYAMRLSIPGYLIHGTNRPGGIGVRSSSGCIRMFPEDIKSFFYQVPLGTPVRIIHSPYKFGYHNNKLYLEAHEPLSDLYYNNFNSYEEAIIKALEDAGIDNIELDWVSTQMAVSLSRGYPILFE